MIAASSTALYLGSETLKKSEASSSLVFGGLTLKFREFTLTFWLDAFVTTDSCFAIFIVAEVLAVRLSFRDLEPACMLSLC